MGRVFFLDSHTIPSTNTKQDIISIVFTLFHHIAERSVVDCFRKAAQRARPTWWPCRQPCRQPTGCAQRARPTWWPCRQPAVDLANSDPRQTAFELHEPENKAGVVIYAPALRSVWFGGKQYWVFVIGNCPTKRGGMGANLSKLFLGIKAAGKWLLYYCRASRSTSSSSTTPSSTSSALALGRVPPTRSDLLTRPDRSSRFDRSYGADGRQTDRPLPEAIANQLVTARSHYEHILTEGLKVLIVPSGLWAAESTSQKTRYEACGVADGAHRERRGCR